MSDKRARNEKKGGATCLYGYDLTETGHLVPNRAEQKAIRLIHDLKGKGYSLRAICRELEKEGHRTKTGKTSWNPKSVSVILKRAANG